jgi:hypothetical protein
VCGAKHFQGPGLLQHCCSKGDEYHTATAFYLTTLFKNGIGSTQAAFNHGENDQSRKTVDANERILIIIINLLTVKNQTILTK